jgi:hypothetical protein
VCGLRLEVVKPRFRVTRHAEDPFLIGRELIFAGLRLAKREFVVYTSQTATTFSSFTAKLR